MSFTSTQRDYDNALFLLGGRPLTPSPGDPNVFTGTWTVLHDEPPRPAWAPWLLHRLDEHHEWVGWYDARDLTLKPSEYFRRQCFVSVDADEETVKHYVDWFGDENLVFSADFPHGDSMYPHAMEGFRKLPLSEASQRKILGANWSRLYGVPLGDRRP